MLKILIDLGDGEPPVWTNTAMDDLIVEDGRVVGARVKRDGSTLNVEARRGVLLAAGGFGHNADMRRRYSGDQPNEGKWSIANAGDTGEVLQTAMRLGAKTDLLDEAWWLPTVFIADGGPPPSRSARDGSGRGPSTSTRTGRRFCNESNSYVEVGKAMYANKAVPCWHDLRRGLRRQVRVWRQPAEEARAARRADRAAAPSCAATPSATSRAKSTFPLTNWSTRSSGSTSSRPRASTPTSAGASRPTTTASAIPGIGPTPRSARSTARRTTRPGCCPADVGTCGGVITNEHAQVLDEQDRVIEGLYATGNITATVMGRTYPGAGASIANTMVFGYVAAPATPQGASSTRARSFPRRDRRNPLASNLTA